jgi:hypothetical protein
VLDVVITIPCMHNLSTFYAVFNVIPGIVIVAGIVIVFAFVGLICGSV